MRAFPVLGFRDAREKPGSRHLVSVGSWGRKSSPGSTTVKWRCSAFVEKEVRGGSISVMTRWDLRGQLQTSGKASF